MRILLPVHHFPPKYSAGAELYTLRLAKSLQSMGHEVSVVAIENIDSGDPGKIVSTLEMFEELPVWRLHLNLVAASERLIWNFDNPLLGEWFADHLASHRPDVVHFQAGYLLGVAPLRATHRASIPTILTFHDFWFLCPRHTLLRSNGALCVAIPGDPAICAWCHSAGDRRSQRLDSLTLGVWGAMSRQILLHSEIEAQHARRKAIAEAIQYTDVLIAPSRYMAQRMSELAGTKSVQYIPYGMETSRTASVGVKEDDVIRVGYLGQIAEHKGVHLLIDAWRKLRSERPRELHLYGGISTDEYGRLLKDLAGDDRSIHFHGRFTHEERDAILAKLDLCVVPSIWYENRPFAITEALAAGVPVVTARLGGMAEMVQDGEDGLHFAPNSATDLARVLQRILDEELLLRHLAQGAGQYAPQSVENESRALADLYAQAIANRAASPEPEYA